MRYNEEVIMEMIFDFFGNKDSSNPAQINQKIHLELLEKNPPKIFDIVVKEGIEPSKGIKFITIHYYGVPHKRNPDGKSQISFYYNGYKDRLKGWRDRRLDIILI